MAPSPWQLEEEVRAIFAAPTFDLQKETQKTIREQVTKRLGLPKFPSDQRETLKQIVTRLIQEEQQPQQQSSSSEEEDEPKPKKKKSQPTKGKKPKTPTSSTSSSSYSSSVQSLLQLGQAMRLGPRLHMGLKDLTNDQERIAVLTERLKEAGASWKGKLPTQQDIAKAKAEKQRKDDLDGIDTSLILGGRGRRRRRGRSVNYAVDVEEEEEEGEEEEEKREVEDAPQKKPKKHDQASTRTGSDGEESEESAEFQEDDASAEDSEAEFD
jgi:hypothetical protein